MALTILEKAKIQRETSTIKAQLKAGDLSILEKAKLQRLWSANIKTLKGESGAKPEVNTVVADFIAGKYSSAAPSALLATVDNVVAAGGTLADIKAGGALWLKARQEGWRTEEAA